MKILLITQNEPFFIPKMVKYLLYNAGKEYEISAVTILAPHRKNKNYLHWFQERAKIYTPIELLIAGILFIYTRINNLLFSQGSYNVRSIIRKLNIAEITTEDVNSQKYINTVRDLNIDVIISISCPQLFKKDLLNSVKYCINAHGTLLPRHRGVFGSWWTLFSGDQVGGSTIHTMELKLDAGEVLWQKEFPIEKDDTQYSIAYKTKRDMAIGLKEVLNQIAENKVSVLKPEYETSYHRAPTKEQGRESHKRGFKVISLKDIKFILAKNF